MTNERRYHDFMDQEYYAIYDFLWYLDDSLFWRDSSYFKRREKNGRNLYRARVNGWIFEGLRLLIPDLPGSWAGRQFYMDLWQQMAGNITRNVRGKRIAYCIRNT